MNSLLSMFAILGILLWSPLYLYAQERPDDGNYFKEDYNEPDPNIDEKHVGSLSTATPPNEVVEKKITKYYKGHGVVEDDRWDRWLGTNFSEVYIIQKGDTLWDISDKFLDSPWYWPKIWELNQYITNPHWIYPGNELKFSYSGKSGPRISIRRKGKRGSDIVDVVPNLFDESGFYKPRYKELMNANKDIKMSLNGGQLCLGSVPKFAGLIEASSEGKTIFSDNDEVQVYMENMKACEQGAKYASVEATEDGVYKINGLIEIEDKSLLSRRCKARVIAIYGVVKRDMHVIDVPVFENIPKNSQDAMIADVYYIEPHEQKQLGSELDRVCVRFRQKNLKAVEPGMMVYFYEATDPITGKTVDPYGVAVGQIIHLDRDVATVLVTASQKDTPVTKKTLGTTRF